MNQPDLLVLDANGNRVDAEESRKHLIQFRVLGCPKAQPRGRGGQPILKNGQPILRVHESGTAEAWKSAVAEAAKPHVPMPPMDCPVRMDIEFRFPRPKSHYRANGELKPTAPLWHTIKPDRDNCEKAVSDALKTIGMWTDDSRICAGQVTKIYASYGDPPGATISIAQLEPKGQPCQ